MITGKSSFWMDRLMPCIKTITMSHCSKNKMELSEHVLYLLPESSALCLLLKKTFCASCPASCLSWLVPGYLLCARYNDAPIRVYPVLIVLTARTKPHPDNTHTVNLAFYLSALDSGLCQHSSCEGSFPNWTPLTTAFSGFIFQSTLSIYPVIWAHVQHFC